MSPVQQRKVGDARSLGLAIGGLLVGVALLVAVFVFAIPQLTESGSVRITPGAASLALGNARTRAESIARDGPVTMADPTGGTRDVILQHTGDDPLAGWAVFDARRPGKGRECTLEWDAQDRVFTDPCDGSTVAADGGDLPRYGVEIDGDENLTAVFVTPTAEPPVTESTTTIAVTGSRPGR